GRRPAECSAPGEQFAATGPGPRDSVLAPGARRTASPVVACHSRMVCGSRATRHGPSSSPGSRVPPAAPAPIRDDTTVVENLSLMLGYLIDMDGVVYRGGHLISGADTFINQLRKDGVPFRFLTNNSQRTRRDVATRLSRLGIDVEEEHIYTCAMATAR